MSMNESKPQAAHKYSMYVQTDGVISCIMSLTMITQLIHKRRALPLLVIHLKKTPNLCIDWLEY